MKPNINKSIVRYYIERSLNFNCNCELFWVIGVGVPTITLFVFTLLNFIELLRGHEHMRYGDTPEWPLIAIPAYFYWLFGPERRSAFYSSVKSKYSNFTKEFEDWKEKETED